MNHYFTDKPTSKSDESLILCEINGVEFKFYTDSGVFSKRFLDFGTRTLLENIELDKSKKHILDFGCGYGPIGIFISKDKEKKVDMIDINERAIKLTEKNISINNVNANVFQSDMYTNVEKKYDYIVTNPPIRIGKESLIYLLKEAQNYLNDDGELWFVINKNQGAKTIAKKLEKNYNIELKSKNKGFYVYMAKNR